MSTKLIADLGILLLGFSAGAFLEWWRNLDNYPHPCPRCRKLTILSYKTLLLISWDIGSNALSAWYHGQGKMYTWQEGLPWIANRRGQEWLKFFATNYTPLLWKGWQHYADRQKQSGV